MLTPEGYKSRLVEKQFDEYMQTFGAVCIEGPKYCGKTWTARSRAKSAAFVGNPENNFQTRTMAQISPDLVLKGDLPRGRRFRRFGMLSVLKLIKTAEKESIF